MRTFHWILTVILPGYSLVGWIGIRQDFLCAKVRVEFPNLTAGAEVPELVKEQVEAPALGNRLSFGLTIEEFTIGEF